MSGQVREVVPIEIAAISFEIVTDKKQRKIGLIVSGETVNGDCLTLTRWDYALVHEMCGRLLGGMVEIDREATLGALRAVLAAYAED